MQDRFGFHGAEARNADVTANRATGRSRASETVVVGLRCSRGRLVRREGSNWRTRVRPRPTVDGLLPVMWRTSGVIDSDLPTGFLLFDLMLIQGVGLVFCLMVLAVNFVVDVL